MRYFFTIGLFAAFLFPAFSLASEEAPDPFMFGGDVNYELETSDASATGMDDGDIDNLAASEMMPPPTDAEIINFAPINQNKIAIPTSTPQVPMLQNPATSTPTPPPSDVVEPMPKIAKDQALTDTIKQNSDASTDITNVIPMPKVEGTWVDKISAGNPLSLIGGGSSSKAPPPPSSGGDSLESMVDKARTPDNANRRSNASVYDISGVMLRMSLQQVNEVMQNRGFRKTMEKFQIPNFIKWRNEEGCRNSGVVGYERLEACVNERAKKEKQQYVQVSKFAKYDTKEEIEITFTSNFTENKVYKITYKSLAASITGNSQKAAYLRNIKVYDFWKKINQKYGKPDNKEAVTWGMGGNKPYLKAKTGFLLLEDPMFRELDYTRMSREDQRYMNTDLYSF